ncbi:MAG: hypothetical protein RRB13_00195 [bacterium]|nr:hypothetical protein [bacterium]
MLKWSGWILLFCCLGASAQAQEGRNLYFESGCDSCHGPMGMALGTPTLAGREVEDLLSKSLMIQHNQNPTGASLMMRENPAMAKLDAVQLREIAVWLSQLDPNNPAEE